MKIESTIGVSGLYKKIEILNKEGVCVREFSGFTNLITDIGISRLYRFNNIFSFCRVGSGSATPLPTDTQLQSQIASTSNTSYRQGNNLADGYCWAEVTYTFAIGAAAGNISEIATGWHAGDPNTIFSRALVLDGNNNPSTITVLPDEILRVTWEHRRYWPTGDSEGSLTNAGNKGGDYQWKCRAMLVGEWFVGESILDCGLVLNSGTPGGGVGITSRYTGEIGDIYGLPSGAPDTNMGRNTVLPNGLKFSFNTNQGNGSTRSVSFGTVKRAAGGLFYQLEFTPPLTKTSDDLLELDVFHNIARR